LSDISVLISEIITDNNEQILCKLQKQISAYNMLHNVKEYTLCGFTIPNGVFFYLKQSTLLIVEITC